jgi:predicted deacylase
MPSSMTAAVRAIGRLFALGVALGISLPASVSVAQIASPAPAAVFAKAELQERRAWVFDEEQGEVRLDNEFSGARVNACERVAPLDYRIVSTPENTPSPWYAFRVSSAVEREITVRIVIATSRSRPRPCVSTDGTSFTRVASKDYEGGEGARECVLRLRVGPKPVFVASNHMIGVAEIEAWTDATSARLGVAPREIGRSQAGRAIRAFEFGVADAREALVVIGRQHPPEVAGTVGFFRFVEAVAADTEGARAFRARFRVLCVPLVNPDGVHEGQWRSTLGAVDTNRDWGPFSQAETRAVRDAILAFTRGAGRTPRLLLDFHATAKDIFYVPPDDALLDPPHFASRWLAAIEKRFPDYAVESNAKNNVNEWTFKRWAFETFGAPGITYELGAATPHERIARIVPGAAEEAMRLLLAEPAPGAAPGAAKAEPSAVGSR